MIFSEVDLLILREFCRLKENEFFTTWKLMKRIFKKGGNPEHLKIRRSIQKMSNYGLFDIRGSPPTYILIEDNVHMQKIKYPDGTHECVCLKIDEKWQSIQI